MYIIKHFYFFCVLMFIFGNWGCLEDVQMGWYNISLWVFIYLSVILCGSKNRLSYSFMLPSIYVTVQKLPFGLWSFLKHPIGSLNLCN